MYYNDIFDMLNAAFDADSDSLTAKATGYSIPSFPPSEMIQNKDGTVKITVALAGYKKQDVVISTEENKVVISTSEDYKKPELEEGVKVIAGNIKHSKFRTCFTIPETKFNFSEISAKFEDGLLEIVVPPKEKKEYKTISID